MVDRDFIQRKTDRLVEYITDLEDQRHISVADWETNKMLRNHLERTLQKTVESCLNIGKHLIAGMNLRTPEDYKDIMVILTEAGILPQEKLSKFKKMAQFRNIIVHDYEKIDPHIILDILRQDLDDLRLFARAIRDRTGRP